MNTASVRSSSQPHHPDQAEKTPGPKASAPSSDAPAPRTAYTPIYQNKTLQLRAPDHFGPTTDFDLDQPKVDIAGGLASDVQDISMFVNEFRAGEAMAKSSGTTPKECEEAVTTDPLEGTLGPSDLVDEQLIAKGDRLCMVTSSGNLAMLKITAVIPPEDDADIPSYSTSVTLWKRAS
ncbi:hypothetical protein [Streptomyces sp. BRA346]|uniref:hypothetical protein n=1 Tax=Streptomyces sp. BRA346 TaxID=2878199 RepID=UPI00406464B6